MARKLTDAPVKVIHILPSEGDGPTANPLLASRRRRFAALVRRVAEWWNQRAQFVLVKSSRMLVIAGGQGDRCVKYVAVVVRKGGAATGRIASRTSVAVYPVMAKLWTSAARVFCAAGEAFVSHLGDFRRRRQRHQRNMPVLTYGGSMDPAKELHVLQREVTAQQADLQRMTAHLADLRALVMSQQQVLLYMGKEMDALQGPAAASLPVEKPRGGRKKKKGERTRETAPAPARYGRAQKEPSAGIPTLSCREASHDR